MQQRNQEVSQPAGYPEVSCFRVISLLYRSLSSIRQQPLGFNASNQLLLKVNHF